MSTENETRNWLLKNYPFEAIFIDEIFKQLNDMYQHLQTNENFEVNESKSLSFEVIKRKETGYLELKVNNLASMMFLGGLGRAISNVIISDIIPMFLKMRIKKCSYCNTTNPDDAKYCMDCGKLF